MDTAPDQIPAFGEVLKRYRQVAGLTQEALAERARLSARAIAALERGVNRTPRPDTLRLLADALALAGPARAAFEAAARPPQTTSPTHAGRDGLGAAGVQGPLAGMLPLLAGRTRELARLERHLAAPRPPQSGEAPPALAPLLLLAGEPGIGKTRLLQEVRQRAPGYGWQLLAGGCQRRGGQEPYAPFVGALQRHIREQRPATLRAELQGCAWLVRLLPELADGPIPPLPPWTLTPEQERRLIDEAVTRFLANVAGPAGTLLLLDDLQWAGRDGLDLLATLARAAADVPLRVIGAYRDAEVRPEDPLAVMVADLAHAGLASQLTLGPLTPTEAAHLLDHLLQGEAAPAPGAASAVREQVLARAGGLPFFLVSCAQAARLGTGEQAAEEVPWDVAQSVRQRVAALPESVGAVLGAAAVVGRVVPPAVLLVAAARPEEEVLEALEAACRARLLVDVEQAYHFTHDVIREVIETDLGTARRLVLHRRVAQIIEVVYAGRLADHYETLANHYLQGDAWQQALDYLVKSGDKATAAGATQAALHCYAQALALCDRLGTPARTVAAVVARKRGFVCYDSGAFPGAAADFERMRAAAASMGDRHLEGLALAFRGMSLEWDHDFEAAEETLRAALAVAEEGFADVRFVASVQLADLLTVIDRHTEAGALLAVAEELAPRVDDPSARALVSILGALVRRWAGHYDDALAQLERWRGAVEESHRIMLRLTGQWEEAMARASRGDYAQALVLLEEVIATCERIGEAVLRARALNTAGWIYGELQDHQHALELNRQSLEAACAIEVSDTEIQSNARLNLGDNLLALGRLDEAEECFQAVERVARHPRPQDRWALGHYAQHLFHSYGELCLVRGDADRALAYAGECLALAESSECRKNIVKACRLRGQVFLARADLRGAEAEFARALELARQVGNPPQLWKTLLNISDLRAAQGRQDDAHQAFNEVRSIIDRVAASLGDKSLRTMFLASDHVRTIRQR
jgi:tetratricopeptide (TPR) repeat protein/transcriptional regulator with XRE-family HTH domain